MTNLPLSYVHYYRTQFFFSWIVLDVEKYQGLEFWLRRTRLLYSDVTAGATVITVLIEGGPTTVEQAFASVARGIPLIVLAGTGKVAKLIATLKYCYDECENK